MHADHERRPGLLELLLRRLRGPVAPVPGVGLAPAPRVRTSGAWRTTVRPTPARPIRPDDPARALPSPVEDVGAALVDDPTPYAVRARGIIAQLRDDHGWALGANDVRAFLDDMERAPTDAVRQLPEAALRALAVCDDPTASSATLVALCEQDPAVAAALLRYANAPCYAPTGESIASLRLAVSRVGVGGVRNVLLDVAVHGLLCDPGPALAPLAARIWGHMVSTGAIARTAARAFGVLPETAYTLGLLHDVGKLVVLDRISAWRAHRGRAPALPGAVLGAILVALHEPLGALALERWGLGADAARAVGDHHRRRGAPDPLAEVIYLAERVELAQRRGHPVDIEQVWRDGALTGDITQARHLLDAWRAA